MSTVVPSAVLFACTFNAVRSPMAMALFRELYGDKAYVESVGVEAGEVDGFVSAVLEEADIPPLVNHKPKTFDDLHDDNFEVIIALTEAAHERALEATRTMACDVIYWATDDPTGVEGSRETQLDAYRQVRDALLARIRQEWSEDEKPVDAPAVKGKKAKAQRVRQHGQVLWNRVRNRLKKLRR